MLAQARGVPSATVSSMGDPHRIGGEMDTQGHQLPAHQSARVTPNPKLIPLAVPLFYLSEKPRAGPPRAITGAPSLAPGKAKAQGRFGAARQGQLRATELIP